MAIIPKLNNATIWKFDSIFLKGNVSEKSHSWENVPKRSKTTTIIQDSFIEILDGSFSNLKPMKESYKMLPDSTSHHEMEVISENSTYRSFVKT